MALIELWARSWAGKARLKKDMDAFVSIQQSCGATVALTDTLYGFAKKVAAIKRVFTTRKNKAAAFPDLRWIVTDKALPKCAAAGGAMIYCFLPETAGLKLEGIEALFSRPLRPPASGGGVRPMRLAEDE